MNIDEKEIVGKTLGEIRKLHSKVNVVGINEEMYPTPLNHDLSRLNVYITGVEVLSVKIDKFKNREYHVIQYGNQDVGIITKCFWG
jgi:hypothetical protein